MRILGIETSCDETAAAVVDDGTNMLSSVIASSLGQHIVHGGVVPEIAARSHLETILPVIDEALKQAKTDWSQIDAVAVTKGPGLIGSLLVGVLTARTLAITHHKPLFGINHVEAHVYADFITKSPLPGYRLPQKAPAFPCLALIVSGGHTQLVLFKNHGNYQILGQTGDDAVGEAFDKVARMLGLPYPGGPSISKAARTGNPKLIKLPLANLANPYDFSFSGLKTAVLRASQTLAGKDYTLLSSELPGLLQSSQKADIAASFQSTAVNTLIVGLVKAIRAYSPNSVVIAGGVAANQELRRQADAILSLKPIYTDIRLCTDNAAMIAACGFYQASRTQPDDPLSLSVFPNLSM